jgi:hypothetical protein
MPKLNATLMILLAAAVIAATGILALRGNTSAAAPPVRAESLLRKLADPDADLRREGEQGLRQMGAAAVEPLREASKSPDRVLAGRAAKLLQELQPSLSPERPSSSAE